MYVCVYVCVCVCVCVCIVQDGEGNTVMPNNQDGGASDSVSVNDREIEPHIQPADQIA